MRRYFIFKSDTVIFILKSTVLTFQNKIIVLENVKEKKIIHLVKYLQKKYQLKVKISHLPRYEKILERYSEFKLNKATI